MKKFLVLSLMIFGMVGCFNEDNDSVAGPGGCGQACYDPPGSATMTVNMEVLYCGDSAYTVQSTAEAHGTTGFPTFATFVYSDGHTSTVDSAPYVHKRVFTSCHGQTGSGNTDPGWRVDVTFHYFTKTLQGSSTVEPCATCSN